MKKLIYILLGLIIIGGIACNEEDEPEYVGSWVTTQQTLCGEAQNKLTLTESNFTVIVSQKISTNLYIDVAGIKGGLAVTENNVVLTPSAVASIDSTGSTGLVWYEKGSDEYNAINDDFFEIPDNVTGEYEINGDELTMKMDNNGDGEYGTDEILVYTRL